MRASLTRTPARATQHSRLERLAKSERGLASYLISDADVRLVLRALRTHVKHEPEHCRRVLAELTAARRRAIADRSGS